MSLASLSRFLSFSIKSKTHKIISLHFTTNSQADKIYTHIKKNTTHNIERTLLQINPKLDSTCVNNVILRCVPNQSQIGLRFFIWAGLQSGYRHSSFMYSRACEIFKINQNPRIIIDLMENYKENRFVVSIKMIKVVLSLCRQARIANEALWVLRKMSEFNLRADTTVYNVVIRLFSEKGDMDTAQKLMEEIGLIHLSPDIVTYVWMLKGFCNAGRLEEACGLFKAMRGHGCVPNIVVYSILLDGVCRYGSKETALGMLGELEKETGDCSPNVVTYTTVMQSFCEKGRTMEALKIFDRMVGHNCVPNRVTTSTLIKGLCVEGRVEEAYKFIDKAVAGGVVSYDDCYSSLVVSLIRIKRVEEAEKLFKKMLGSGVKPDSVACSIMIKELCLQGRVIDGFCFYEEIEKKEFLSSIDSDIYSILLAGLCQQSHLIEASKFARLVLEKRIPLNAIYVDGIVEHLKKSGDQELATHFTRLGS
ncbi:PPR domain-containing protein/PPR_2 domain-containing protein [Cephalotus follicularis]|uniref:PPR domain-containing protein/PPR_2 domain-containing protein n=1 Tax=Cephalotus follicularis TaxID=3775 RepID=A0A1Q3BK17_CEPFO|nr:PPR domain-containing protein/PPR_2 domain-containing protein [Cephalotus follicularis]